MYFFSPVQSVRLARAQCAECHLVAGPSPNPAAPTFDPSRSMIEKIDTVVVGGGQAGLARLLHRKTTE
jgi:hypothetical protein